MIWLGFIGSAAIVGAFFAQGYHFGYKAAKAEDEHHDLTIENGYLKLLGAEREAPHCPTCECGGEPQIRQLCPECLGYMPCAQHPTTNEKQS